MPLQQKPGIRPHPNTGTGDGMRTATTLVQRTAVVLRDYVRVHDAMYGASLWRAIRRIVPIPGFFEAIPYAAHGASLSRLRVELTQVAQDTVMPDVARDSGADAQTLSDLRDYAAALEDTVSRLMTICDELADKANGDTGPSWREYRRSLREYERSRANSARLGSRLNDALRSVPREA